MSNKRIGGTLNHWWVSGDRVRGTITGDPKWPENEHLTTSPIVSISEDRKTLETMNTIYTLGEEAKGMIAIHVDSYDYFKAPELLDYLKLYIVIRSDTPDEMVPVLVAHSILNADKYLSYSAQDYGRWKNNSFRKVVVKANPSQFQKLKEEFGVFAYHGDEINTCNGETTCLIVAPIKHSETPKSLRRLRLWKPNYAQQNS